MLKKKTKVTSLNKLVNVNLELPEVNQSIFTLENNGNSIFDYLLTISEIENIKDIKICSFRISKRDLSFLEELIEKKQLKPIKLLLSDSIPSMVIGTFNYLTENVNFETNYKNTHAKYCLVKTQDGNYYSILSSGNFNPDGKIEQLNIINNKQVYDLFYSNE